MAKGEGETAKGELESTRRALGQLQVELEVKKGELERTSRELSHTQGELEVRKGKEERVKTELETTRGELESSRRELQHHQMKLEKSGEDLVRTSGELERVRQEATETRQLFEGEVRSKSKLIADLEKSQAGISQAVEKVHQIVEWEWDLYLDIYMYVCDYIIVLCLIAVVNVLIKRVLGQSRTRRGSSMCVCVSACTKLRFA